MAALTPAQLKTIKQRISALRQALNDLEAALDPNTRIDPELEAFIEKNVPGDEVVRLSEIVPALSEIQKDLQALKPPRPKRRR